MPPFAIAAIVLAATFGLLALWALGWSIAKGQYRDFAAGARSIFDEEEPVGEATDAFPESAASEDNHGRA